MVKAGLLCEPVLGELSGYSSSMGCGDVIASAFDDGPVFGVEVRRLGSVRPVLEVCVG